MTECECKAYKGGSYRGQAFISPVMESGSRGSKGRQERKDRKKEGRGR